jgi:TonB family protein
MWAWSGVLLLAVSAASAQTIEECRDLVARKAWAEAAPSCDGVDVTGRPEAYYLRGLAHQALWRSTGKIDEGHHRDAMTNLQRFLDDSGPGKLRRPALVTLLGLERDASEADEAILVHADELAQAPGLMDSELQLLAAIYQRHGRAWPAHLPAQVPQAGEFQVFTPSPAPPLPAGSLPKWTSVVRGLESVTLEGMKLPVPTQTRTARPAYPDIALQARVQGRVILECQVDEKGRVTAAKVLRGIPLLDQPALAVAPKWRFAPTLVDGVAVPVVITMGVDYTIQ